MKKIDIKTPDLLLKLLLFCWWAVNLVQAIFTELANDEAYYWIFAQNLDWGYFDHPPMTALLIWLGNWMGGSLGVRFFFTILQPVYLYIIWLLIRPATVSKRDVWLFFLIAAAMPILMLYGFIAVPDGPLMVFTALFLLCFKRFAEKNSWLNTLLLGISMAALVYSKYHAALVVIFAFLANYKFLLNPKTYFSGLITVALIVPHLLWQNSHDWCSFHYHLLGRNGYLKWNYIAEYLMNIVLVFNPLFFVLYLSGWKKSFPPQLKPEHRALYCITAGFVIFFLISGFRGYIQPQWIIPITFGLIMILFNYVRNSPKLYAFVSKAAVVTVVLLTVFRIVMIFNPLSLKFEIFDNKKSYAQIAEISKGKPVIFGGSYAIASKYIYYTGCEAYSQPSINYRTSHWEYIDNDSRFAGRSVILDVPAELADSVIDLANGRKFAWTVIDDFRPVRKVDIEINGMIPESVHYGDNISLKLLFTNPYDYDIRVSPDELPLVMAWGRNKEIFNEFIIENASFVIPAGGKILRDVQFVVPESLDRKNYLVGFLLKYNKMNYWFNSKIYKTNLIIN